MIQLVIEGKTFTKDITAIVPAEVLNLNFDAVQTRIEQFKASEALIENFETVNTQIT